MTSRRGLRPLALLGAWLLATLAAVPAMASRPVFDRQLDQELAEAAGCPLSVARCPIPERTTHNPQRTTSSDPRFGLLLAPPYPDTRFRVLGPQPLPDVVAWEQILASADGEGRPKTRVRAFELRLSAQHQAIEEFGLEIVVGSGIYLDPELGRFLSEDPFVGMADQPPSLHRYLYGYANPTVYLDLTGEATVSLFGRFEVEVPDPVVDFSRRQIARNTGRVLQVAEFGQGLAQVVRDPTGPARQVLADSASDALKLDIAMVVSGLTLDLDPMRRAGDQIQAERHAQLTEMAKGVPVAATASATVDAVAARIEFGPESFQAEMAIGRAGAQAWIDAATLFLARAIPKGRTRVVTESPSTPGTLRVYRIGERMPDGRIAGDGPGAALKDGPDFPDGGAPARGSANPVVRAAAGRGSSLHADKPGRLPDQLRQRYPESEFEFTKPGVSGQDVTVGGGRHPSEHPNSAWPAGVDKGDFKPDTPGGRKTFKRDQARKWDEETVMLPYDPKTGRLVGSSGSAD